MSSSRIELRSLSSLSNSKLTSASRTSLISTISRFTAQRKRWDTFSIILNASSSTASFHTNFHPLDDYWLSAIQNILKAIFTFTHWLSCQTNAAHSWSCTRHVAGTSSFQVETLRCDKLLPSKIRLELRRIPSKIFGKSLIMNHSFCLLSFGNRER